MASSPAPRADAARDLLDYGVLEASLDGILVLDENRRKVVQNQRCIDIWKIPPEIVAQGDEVQVGLDGAGFLFLGFPDRSPQADGMAFKGHLSALPASTLNVEAPRAASVRIVKHDAVFTGELMVILADGISSIPTSDKSVGTWIRCSYKARNAP